MHGMVCVIMGMVEVGGKGLQSLHVGNFNFLADGQSASMTPVNMNQRDIYAILIVMEVTGIFCIRAFKKHSFDKYKTIEDIIIVY